MITDERITELVIRANRIVVKGLGTRFGPDTYGPTIASVYETLVANENEMIVDMERRDTKQRGY